MKRDQPLPGQESVWDYPRPPRVEKSSRTVVVLLNGCEIARSSETYRILETSHPPTWYIPPAGVRTELLTATEKHSFCEWKGSATYWTVRVKGKTAENAVWCYPAPERAFFRIRNYFAFYPQVFECYVDGERVKAQPGGFYGGWITKDVVGSFKGIPGSSGW